jgi:hypothetical protein
VRAKRLTVALAALGVAGLFCLSASATPPPLHEFSISTEIVLDEHNAGRSQAIALIDEFAYVSDVLSFYQDQIANESFLQTDRGDRLSLRVRTNLGDVEIRCVVTGVERGLASGPCAAVGFAEGAGTWTGTIEPETRLLGVDMHLRVVCRVCPN